MTSQQPSVQSPQQQYIQRNPPTQSTTQKFERSVSPNLQCAGPSFKKASTTDKPMSVSQNNPIPAKNQLGHKKKNRIESDQLMFYKGLNFNKTHIRESDTFGDVQRDLNLLKPKKRWVYERVPNDRIEQYNQWRTEDWNGRDQFLVNSRFPQLSRAREAYLGNSPPKSPLKKQHAEEITKFSEVVYRLAQEEEPHRVRRNYQALTDSHKSLAMKTTLQKFGSKNLDLNKKPTLTSSVKDKYIVRSRHEQQGNLKFIPTSLIEARETLRSAYEPDRSLFDEKKDNCWKRNSKHSVTIHGPSAFLATSPVTQDVNLQFPDKSMNMDSTFAHFIPPSSAGTIGKQRGPFSPSSTVRPTTQRVQTESTISKQPPTPSLNQHHNSSEISSPVTRSQKEKSVDKKYTRTQLDLAPKNPRQHILENFKEIQRIMTQNFLVHKKLEKKYGTSNLPRGEQDRKSQEERAQRRMTNILKKMHQPTEYQNPVSRSITSPSSYEESQKFALSLINQPHNVMPNKDYEHNPRMNQTAPNDVAVNSLFKNGNRGPSGKWYDVVSEQ